MGKSMEFLRVLEKEAEHEAERADKAIKELSTKYHCLSGRLPFPYLELIMEDTDSDEACEFYWEERKKYYGEPPESRSPTFWLEDTWLQILENALAVRRLLLVDRIWIGWSC